VARIVVPEGDATSYGSGTLVDVRDQYGLVVTNWHVVRDGTGEVEVIFPDGFRSKARPLKVDADWDLAALVIWRPTAAAVKLAATAPQPGEQLTICGYGPGNYRAATGRCTQYYAPSMDLPQHMVELDVEARQGDSGGPIFNSRGELAGVLFGAGQGTTLGSFGGRVENFLASLAPNIGSGTHGSAAIAHADAPQSELEADNINRGVSAMLVGTSGALRNDVEAEVHAAPSTAGDWRPVNETVPTPQQQTFAPSATNVAMSTMAPIGMTATTNDFAWLETAKNILAMVGAATILVLCLRLIR
jgi:S1-C subfamily serine protease